MEGQLGLGRDSKTDALMVWKPTILPDLTEKVRSISCGENFTAAILGSLPSGCDAIPKLHGASIGASISASQRRAGIESRTNREMMWRNRVSKEFLEMATGTRDRVSDRSNREWRRGVPSCLRSEMWPIVIGNAAKVTRHMFEHHGCIAEQCLSRARTCLTDFLTYPHTHSPTLSLSLSLSRLSHTQAHTHTHTHTTQVQAEKMRRFILMQTPSNIFL